MKVGIYFRQSEVEKTVERFKQLLDVNKIEYELLDYDKTYDILIVFGGDGTVLSIAPYAISKQIPILAINAGTVGFLSSYEENELDKAVNYLTLNSLHFTCRSVIEVNIDNKTYYALNDAVIERDKAQNSKSVVSKLKLSIGNNYVYSLSSDGIIISTPTGSTAYSLSAGGVILTPDLKSFIATPICSHSLTSRPIVYSDDKTAEVEILHNSCDCILSIDGRPLERLVSSNKVTFKKSTKSFLLIENDCNFFTRLVKKLGD